MSVSLPIKTGGPPYPPYATDATKYGLSILDWFAGHIMSGLMANTVLTDRAFISSILAQLPLPTEPPADAVSSSLAQPASSLAEPRSPAAPKSMTPTSEMWGPLEFQFSTSTTEPITGSALQLNNGNQTLATLLWVAKLTADGIDATTSLKLLNAGCQLYLQDKDDSAKWMKYSVTGPVVDKGYLQIPITYIAGGAPLPAQRILFVASGGAEEPSPEVPFITPEDMIKVAYVLAAELIELRDGVPINPTPVPVELSGPLIKSGKLAVDPKMPGVETELTPPETLVEVSNVPPGWVKVPPGWVKSGIVGPDIAPKT